LIIGEKHTQLNLHFDYKNKDRIERSLDKFIRQSYGNLIQTQSFYAGHAASNFIGSSRSVGVSTLLLGNNSTNVFPPEEPLYRGQPIDLSPLAGSEINAAHAFSMYFVALFSSSVGVVVKGNPPSTVSKRMGISALWKARSGGGETAGKMGM
jgi:hypothetical protein